MPVLKIHSAVFSIQLKMHGDRWVTGRDEKCYSKNGPSEKQYKNMENMRNNGSSQKMKARSNHRSVLKNTRCYKGTGVVLHKNLTIKKQRPP